MWFDGRDRREIHGVLNPFMLFGLLAVGVPILIHLILRQRPKPRPWGAMRWLRAAILAAQRRYRLTNLLLLLLRCLALAVLALALARPYLSGLGSGNHLVLVVDLTASMGPTNTGMGALEDFRRSFRQLEERERQITLVTVSDRVAARPPSSWSELTKALDKLAPSHIPGGLDSTVSDELRHGVLDHCRDTSDVILVSDFRQDRADKLLAVLEPTVHSVLRWRVGENGTNSLITGLHEMEDLLPGHPADLILNIQGPATSGELAVDNGVPQPISFGNQGMTADGTSRARLSLPALESGRHILHFTLADDGLTYDNPFDLPVTVHGRIAALAVEGGPSYTGTALEAAKRFFEVDRIRPALLGSHPLPEHGLVLLRSAPGTSAGTALARWVRQGGVLWSDIDLIEGHPDLASLIPEVRHVSGSVVGGHLKTGWTGLDENLAQRPALEAVRSFQFGERSEVLLRAGDKPVVAAIPAERGWVVAEAVAIERIDTFTNTGPFVEWVRRCGRDYTQRVHRPVVIEAGSVLGRDRRLRRDGREIAFAAGEPLLVENGLWTEVDAEGGEDDLIVIPNRQEGLLAHVDDAGMTTEADEAIPRDRAESWSWWLFVLLLAILIGEGALAAWAGKTYGT